MQFRFSARGICFTTLLNPVNEAQSGLCNVMKVKIYQFDDAENSKCFQTISQIISHVSINGDSFAQFVLVLLSLQALILKV